MSCDSCKSNRVMSFSGKCSDMCFIQMNGKEHDGYVPSVLGGGLNDSGDYIKGELCLDCGKWQGNFPKPTPKTLV